MTKNIDKLLQQIEQIANEERQAAAKAAEWGAREKSAFQKFIDLLRANKLDTLFMKDARSMEKEEKKLLEDIRKAYFRGRGWDLADKAAKTRWADFRRRVRRALEGNAQPHRTSSKDSISWKAQAAAAQQKVASARAVVNDAKKKTRSKILLAMLADAVDLLAEADELLQAKIRVPKK